MAKQENSTKWARMRQVAVEEPKEAEAAIAEVSNALGTMADALSNLRDNLDLVEQPKTASLRARIYAAKKYASSFRRLAEDTPEVVADAISEVYHSLDDVAGALENLAENMGIELELSPAEEAFGEEGKEEESGEFPESTGEPEVDEKKFDEAEEELESPEAEPEEEELDEEIEKEAGSIEFTTDRDENGEPQTPVLAAKKKNLKPGEQMDGDEKKKRCKSCGAYLVKGKCPVDAKTCGRGKKANEAEQKEASGSAGFVTDRDNNGKPESPSKTEAPEAQGESEENKTASEKREALRQRIAKRWKVSL